MTPARLHKKVEDEFDIEKFIYSILAKAEEWILNHSVLVLIVVICLLIALFVNVIFLMIGVSAVESGMMRNFINGGYV